MTCEEKYKREHVGSIGVSINSPGCPQDHGYLPAPKDCPWPYRLPVICMACWNREIPENNDINKEKEEMNETTCPNYVPRDEAPRTSAEIKAEIRELHGEYRRKADILEHELEITRKREELEAAACELKLLVDSYISAGFTRDEAMSIVLTNIKALSIN